MTDARRIASDTELARVAAAGAGFVIDPFNRRWHRASCARVAAMTTGEAKWFADSEDALRRYREQRLATDASAKPIMPCPACSARTPTAVTSQDAPAPAITSEEALDLTVTPIDRGFVARSSHRVTFGPAKGSPAAEAKAELCRHLAILQPSTGEVLHAVLGGSIPANSDVENQLIYNVFDGAGSVALARGVRFELDDAAPAAAFEYRYRVAVAGQPFAYWVEDDPVVAWPGLDLAPGSSDRLLARTWWTLSRAKVEFDRRVPGRDRFAVRAELNLPHNDNARLTADRLKQLVDGIVCAFQRHVATDEATARIAMQLGVDVATVSDALAAGNRAVLGDAERAIGLTKAGVQWNPDDARLVAAEIVVRSAEVAAPRLAGRVAPVARRV
jgi:hypothetical protein